MMGFVLENDVLELAGRYGNVLLLVGHRMLKLLLFDAIPPMTLGAVDVSDIQRISQESGLIGLDSGLLETTIYWIQGVRRAKSLELLAFGPRQVYVFVVKGAGNSGWAFSKDLMALLIEIVCPE